MGVLDWLAILFGYSTFQVDGTPLPNEPTVNLAAGSGVALAGSDYPSLSTSTVTISAVPATPWYLTSSSSSMQIVCTGIEQAVSVDTTAGAVTPVLPLVADCVDGQVVALQDLTDSWGTTPPDVAFEASGVYVENPQSPGEFVTGGSVTCQKANGAGVRLRLYKEFSKWKIA
jgi:hypothetical protein